MRVAIRAIHHLGALGADPLPPASVLPPGVDDNPNNRYYYAAFNQLPAPVQCDWSDLACIARDSQIQAAKLQLSQTAQQEANAFYASGARWSPGGGPIDPATAWNEGLLTNQPTIYVPPVSLPAPLQNLPVMPGGSRSQAAPPPVSQPANQPANQPASQPATPPTQTTPPAQTPAALLSGFHVPAFLTDEYVKGVQNWILVAAGVGAAFLAFQYMGHRR